MNPGKDLDIKIAELVLKWKQHTTSSNKREMAPGRHYWKKPNGDTLAIVPNFSTDADAAEEIIEAIYKMSPEVQARFVDQNVIPQASIITDYSKIPKTEADPLKVCMAALAALRII